MKNIMRVMIVFTLLSTMSGYAQTFDEETVYVLEWPEWGEQFEAYEAERYLLYEVKVFHRDEKTFRLEPVNERERWAKSLWEQDIKGWFGRIGPDGMVEISGAMGLPEAYAVVELKGAFVAEDIIKGQAEVRVGMSMSGETPFVYKSEWGLRPVKSETSLEISRKVTYHGPPISVIEATVPSAEERAQRPVNSDRRIKRFAGYPPHERERFYKGMPREQRTYYDTLLAELTWEEIACTSGILLVVDHLSNVSEEYQQKITEGYVRDGSLHFFDTMSFEELQHVPPLLATVYVLDKMLDEDVQGLQEASARFLTMIDAYRAIPAEELEDLPMPEFILTISEQLPEAFRSAYYAQSPKLRAYVSASDDERLQGLYPF